MKTLTETEYAERAEKLSGNWRRWESFACGRHHRPEDFDRWCIVYTSNRDSQAIERSNARAIAKAMVGFLDVGEDPDCTSESHSHWAVGHVDGYAIRVYSTDGAITPAFKAWCDLQAQLEDYPILDEEDCSTEEMEDADEVWANCYKPKDRIEYIRKHRSQFDFRDLADLLGCVRGKYFAGDASELIY